MLNQIIDADIGMDDGVVIIRRMPESGFVFVARSGITTGRCNIPFIIRAA